jgi:hypothetical protein
MRIFYSILIVLLFLTQCTEEETTSRKYPRVLTLSYKESASDVILTAEITFTPGPIDDHGFLFSTSSIYNDYGVNKISLGSRSNTGGFETRYENFEKGKTYYFKAYAKYENYTVYGNEISFVFKGN